MSAFDFDAIEDELELVVPDVYRMFIEAVESNRFDPAKYGFCHNSKTLIKANLQRRFDLANAHPLWAKQYMDFGVGDGCGNYFFLVATDQADDLVKLWSHDPPGIEDIATATGFLQHLLTGLRDGFQGNEKYLFYGTAG